VLTKFKLRTAVLLSTVGLTIFGFVGTPTGAHATLTSTCGLACVGTTTPSGSFPAVGGGPFSLSLSGSALSVKNLLGGDTSQAPISGTITGHWLEACNTPGTGTLNQLIQTVGQLVGPAVGLLLHTLGMGTGCGTAFINGSATGVSLAGNPATGLAIVGLNAPKEGFVILLVGKPSSYQGVFVNVNPDDLANIPNEIG